MVGAGKGVGCWSLGCLEVLNFSDFLLGSTGGPIQRYGSEGPVDADFGGRHGLCFDVRTMDG